MEVIGQAKLTKGLYSTDGFVSINDSDSLIFNEDGSLGKRTDKRVDIYLFMYKRDFGACLKRLFYSNWISTFDSKIFFRCLVE